MFKINDSVLVAVSDDCGDLYSHDFCGTVVAIEGDYITVEDQDGDSYEVEKHLVLKE